MSEVLLIGLFVVGYLCIALEHLLHVNKAGISLLMAVACWGGNEQMGAGLSILGGKAEDLLKSRKDGRVGAGSFLSDSRLFSPRTGPRTAFARQEREELLRRHLAGLDEPLAEVLMLRYFEDLGQVDIARVLDLPESTVHSRLLAGRRELQRRLSGQLP